MRKQPSSRDTIDFIGIGAVKSGTTWVAEALRVHPQVLFAADQSVKELHFFCTDDNPIIKDYFRSRYERGWDWYLAQFPAYEEGKIRGEFCNSYLVDEQACQRIRKHLPQVKLIVVLRNPVEMLHSLYWWHRGSIMREVPDTFHQAIQAEAFLDLGRYHHHLSQYWQAFPREQIQVFTLGEIRADPAGVLQQLYRYLEVNGDFVPTGLLQKKLNPAIAHRFQWLRDGIQQGVSTLNRIGLSGLYQELIENKTLYALYQRVNLVPRQHPAVDSTDKALIIDYLKDDIRRLEKMLARDLSTWLC